VLISPRCSGRSYSARKKETYIDSLCEMWKDQSKTQDYRIKRLTFGVKSSPYLATQVIRHVAESHSQSHPEASKAILEDFYVDDFLSGAEKQKKLSNCANNCANFYSAQE